MPYNDLADRNGPHLNFEHPYFSLANCVQSQQRYAKEKAAERSATVAAVLKYTRTVALQVQEAACEVLILLLDLADLLLNAGEVKDVRDVPPDVKRGISPMRVELLHRYTE